MDDIQKLEFKIVQVEARIYSWKRKVAVLEIDPHTDEVETDKMLDEIIKLKQRIEELKKEKVKTSPLRRGPKPRYYEYIK